MIQSEPIGLLNTGLPVALLVAVAICLPLLLVHRHTRSHAQVASSIGITALVLLALGTSLFGISYGLRGHAVTAALASTPLAVGLFFGRLAAMAALVWLPVLALVWYSLAQRVEKTRGQHIAKVSDP